MRDEPPPVPMIDRTPSVVSVGSVGSPSAAPAAPMMSILSTNGAGIATDGPKHAIIQEGSQEG